MTKEQVTNFINRYAEHKALSYEFLQEIKKYYKVICVTETIYFVEELQTKIIIDYSIY